ncbi:GNAT family N-acetyltransferase [Frondihabitans sp. 762G35]|uniref:GNAT family N-acetyltransferase n=1 Tax=Frondihabitans sp. 762G35 TaxID=1446794 RepID=UPI000E706DB4|nr:GNAT family N-acetyltransferase [Frondihabitans sp. 762G35]
MSPSSTAIRLRNAEMSDREACVALWVAACGVRDGRAVPGVGDRARLKFDRAVAWTVAEREDGVIVGFALATPAGSGLLSDPPDAAVVGLLAVDPAAQGTGAGRLLLSRITADLAGLHFEQAVLHVLVDNRVAVGLYESAGWVPLGPTTEHSLLERPVQTYVRGLQPDGHPADAT